jgi:hypothetical protein
MSGLDLYQSQGALALLFVYAAAAGFFLGGWYALLRLLRVLSFGEFGMGKQGSKPKLFAVALFLGDVIFAVTAALTLILLLYYRNDGQLRAPAVLGMACGFFAFKETLGRMVGKLEKPLSRLVKRVVRLSLSPLLWTGRITARAARFLWRITVGKALSQSRERQTERVIEDLRQAANRGFDLSVSPEHSPEKK